MQQWMQVDELTWSQRLEKFSVAMLICCFLAEIGDAPIGYNIGLGFFTLYAVYTRLGRALAVAGVFAIVALLMDICIMMVYSDFWSLMGHQYSFAYAMTIFAFLLKILICISLYHMLATTGFYFPDVSAPVIGGEYDPAANLKPGDTYDFHEDDDVL